MTGVTMEIADVLTALLAKSGISESALGREIGVPRATINRIISGRTPDPRISTLNAIAGYFDITVDQLLGKQLFCDVERNLPGDCFNKSIPVIEWDDAKDWESVIKRPEHDFSFISIDKYSDGARFGIKIKGGAMSPQFQENTILIVDPEKKPKNRDFIVVFIAKNKEVLFRQLIIDGSYKFIKAINNIFPTIELQGCDIIIGVVVQTRHDID